MFIYLFLKKNIYYLIALSVFCVFGLYTLFHHELWYEEVHGWLFARDSFSLINLYSNLKYEGHPLLWYVLLYFVTRFTHDVLWMQLLHFIIGCGCVCIFLYCAPFTRLQKILFSFGYFPFFEYLIISRNYGIGMLFLFLYCALYKKRLEHLWLSALILGLLAHTSPIGFLLACVFSLFLIIELFAAVKKKALPFSAMRIVSVLLLVVLLATSLVKLIPPKDHSYILDNYGYFSPERVGMVSLILVRGYVPVPHFEMHFWNTHFLIPDVVRTENGSFHINSIDYVFLSVALVITIFLFLYCVCVFVRKPVVLGIYLFGTMILLALFYMSYYGAVRHYGFLYLLFVCCVWISRYYSEQFLPIRIHLVSLFALRVLPVFLTALFGSHIVAGVYASYMDIQYPFSTRKAVSSYILQHNLGGYDVIGDLDAYMTPLALYLNKNIYYPRSNRLGTFVIMDSKRVQLSPDDLVQWSRRHVVDTATPAILALSYPLKNMGCVVRLVHVFSESVSYDDTVYLYTISPQCDSLALH